MTGTCFAVLAGLSISAIITPFRRLQWFSIVVAVLSVLVAYMALRKAKAGSTSRETAGASLVSGMAGALIGLVAIAALLFLFRPDAQAFLAHAVGRPASSFTIFRLLVGGVLLGFGAGFVARIRTRG